jgi:hypothetical protein
LPKRTNAGEPGRDWTIDETKKRKAVARAIGSAIKQIAAYDPELAEILKAEIRSGETLSHIPRPK